MKADEVRFVRKRVKFSRLGVEGSSNSGHDSVILVYRGGQSMSGGPRFAMQGQGR